MKIIGLTGSIGMGKSLAASLLRTLGIPVFDSDVCVHSLLSGVACPLILSEFPEVSDNRNNCIDRQKLGHLVFNDAAAKIKVESILHPLVWAEQQKFIAHYQRMDVPYIVLDIPLLFETGRDRICDITLCVTAPTLIQAQRVLSRPHMTQSKFKAILQNQWSDHDKKKRADFVIPTGLGRANTLKYLKKALDLE